MKCKIHVLVVAFAGKILPTQLCEMPMNDNTSIAVFLPSERGQGQCPVALIHYLVKNLHEFLNEVEVFQKVK